MYKIDHLEQSLQIEREKEKKREETCMSRINDSLASMNEVKEKFNDLQSVVGMKK